MGYKRERQKGACRPSDKTRGLWRMPSPPWGLAKMRAVQKTELGNNCGLFSDQSHLAFSSLTFFTVLNTHFLFKIFWGVSLRRRALVLKTNPFFLLGGPIKTLRSKVLFF